MNQSLKRYTPAPTRWHWRPAGPLQNNPLFAWPIAWRSVWLWYFHHWKPLSEYVIFLVLAVLAWELWQPALSTMQDFNVFNPHRSQLFWGAAVYLRNLVLVVVFAGGFHLYFYTFAVQKKERKYEPQMLSADSSRFTFGKQVYDNMFWTLISGVTIWTMYELILLLSMAKGLGPLLHWQDNPAWFVALFLLIPLWISLHFYLGHRLLHWPPLYNISHIVHHRNMNTGPWSGISMHPIEHVIYLSSLLIHLFIPSHPIHIFFHGYALTLSAIFGHVGYDALVIRGKAWLAIGHFHHQLHHKHFECNYGAAELPCDAWFGSFDDGSADARRRIREKTHARFQKNRHR